MKKTAFGVLMIVMAATACLAEEIKPDRLFSIEGTQWKMLPIMMMIVPFPLVITLPPLPSVYPEPDLELPSFGFYGDKVYLDDNVRESSLYVNMLVASIFTYDNEPDHQSGAYRYLSAFGVLQPTGIGLISFGVRGLGGAIALLVKVNDNWIPLEDKL